MRLAMPKDGDSLNQHFGQSRSFLIVTIENGQIVDQYEVGTDNLQHNHAGLSGLFLEHGVSLVVTGGIGGPALQALQSKGLQVIRGASGTCNKILADYLNGQIKDRNVTCGHHQDNHHHHNNP